MAARPLTDRKLKSLKRAATGKRYEVMDVEAPGLGIRVNDRGRKTFVLIARYPGSRNPARRTLGEYDAMSLAEAREMARAWRKLLRRGVDPRVEEERRIAEELRK